MELKRKIKKLILVIIFVLSFLQSGPTIQAYAFGGIGIKTEFDSLDGDARFLGSEYRSNYKLDLEELGITQAVDKGLNGIANIIFTLIAIIGYMASSLFYYVMDFDLASLLEPQIKQIQQTLHNGLFTPLFPYAFVGSMILAIVKYARRDFVGLIEQFGKVCFVIVLSYLVITDSAKLLSYGTNITKGASVSILTGINDIDVGNNVKSYAANAAGVLWIGLVHEPWKALEFGEYNYSEEDVEFFLSHSGEERKNKVASMMEGDKGPFSKERTILRIGQGIIVLILTTAKAVVYMLVSLMYGLFQVLAVFWIILAPIILLLTLIPGYDFEILGVYARKIMETQIGVLIITFVIGFMVFFDRALNSLAKEMGWLIVLVLQIAVCIGLYAFRWQILMSFNNLQRGIQNPRLLKRQILKSGNPYNALERQYMFNQFGRAMYKSNKKHEKDNGNSDNLKSPSIPPAGVTRPTTTSSQNSQNQNNERSYDYTSGSVTDNWRDEWNRAAPNKRPTTQEQARVVRTRPMLAQANSVVPVQSSARQIGTANSNRTYNRSSQYYDEPRTVGFGEVIELPDRSDNSNGNIKALPDKSRPVTDPRFLLPDNTLQTSAAGRNVVKLEPRVSGVSFNHSTGHIPREKIDPTVLNRIGMRSGDGTNTANSQVASRPSTVHSRMEAAASSEGMKHQPKLESSRSGSATLDNQANIVSKDINRPVTNSVAVETTRPVQAKSSSSMAIPRPTQGSSSMSTTRPVQGKSNSPSTTSPMNKSAAYDAGNGSRTYNSASAKISDTAMREVKSEQSGGYRPRITRSEENNKTYSHSDIQEKITGKKLKPVKRTTSKQVVRHNITKQGVEKTIKTAPKAQNSPVNGFKSYEGNTQQDVVKMARKGIQIPN